MVCDIVFCGMTLRQFYIEENHYHYLFKDIREFVGDLLRMGETLSMDKVRYTLTYVNEVESVLIDESFRYCEVLFTKLDQDLKVLDSEPNTYPFYRIEMFYDNHSVSRIHFQ